MSLESTKAGSSDLRHPPVVSRPRVLLADDSTSILDLLSDLLDRRGYDVTSVRTGIETYNLLTGCRSLYSLAIIDVYMPNWSGVEALDMARGLGAALPVILMSGFPIHEDDSPSGVFFLLKPFTVQDFNELINKIQQGH